jgi:hypothetical protein
VSIPCFDKDPSAVLDYQIDWSRWMKTDDTISASTWTITPDEAGGVKKDSDSFTPAGITTIWLSGGNLSVTYTVTNQVITTAGRTDERSIEIEIINR